MKPEVTIISAEDYKKYKEEYKKDDHYFDYDIEPMLIPKDYLKPYSRCITTTRDVKDDRIGLLCIGLDNQFYFRKIEDTSVAFFKPVIKNISHYKKISSRIRVSRSRTNDPSGSFGYSQSKTPLIWSKRKISNIPFICRQSKILRRIPIMHIW